jgi:addiction module RelE/StbE family toxin
VAELTWHPEAAEDLDRIATYLEHESPAVARALAQRITAAIERLRQFPRSGRIVPEEQDDAIREVLVGPYRVVYRLLYDDVQIVMIRHGSQILGEVRDLYRG